MGTASLEIVAMSRYFAFAAIALAIIRSVRDSWASIKEGGTWLTLLRGQFRNLWLLPVLGYYIHALYLPGNEMPNNLDLVLLNMSYAMYFLFTTIPKFRRASDQASIAGDIEAS